MRPDLQTGPLCTRQSLVDELRGLGVNHGDILLVHSSLRALGWVNGGAEAVVLALLDSLGATGTLVVPTHSGDNSDPSKWAHPPVREEWWQTIRDTMPVYNPQTTRTRQMGVISETVRTWPGAIRSSHPQASFAAVGAQASALMAGHAVNCQFGEQSPLARLEDANARVLLLGVDFGCCTAFHLAEYRVPSPVVENSFAVMTLEGRQWMTVRDTFPSDERFNELGADLERDRPVTRGTLGAATVRLFSLADSVAYAQRWLLVNRPYTASYDYS